MVRIITDTTSVISTDFARQHGVLVIPQVINFGNESFLEGKDIDIVAFMHRLYLSPELPKTAAPPPELFIQEFEWLVPRGETILCIHPSLEVSGTVRSALTAKAEFPDADIRVIDTRLIASPLASIVQCAVAWAEAGMDADTIERKVREMAQRGRIYFLVATLDYLARGGRIGGAAALMGSLLQIKPILTFEDGRVNQFEKVRTHKLAIKRLKELVLEQYPRGQDGCGSPEGYLTVMHASAGEQGSELAESLRLALGLAEVPLHDMPPAIVTHGGPGILAVGFFVE